MDELASKIYQSVAEDNQPRVLNHWHASSLAECPRSHYFKRLGVPPINRPGAGKMLRWQAGHIMETVLRPHLLKTYPDLVSNVRLQSTKLDLTGEYDNYSEAEATIFEVKSVHDFAFVYRNKQAQRFHLKDSKPYLNHELQNHGYALLLQEQGQPVSFITYVYITLDGRIATYQTALNPEILANVQKRLAMLNKAWVTKSPPICLCSNQQHPLYKSTMQYCDFKQGETCCDTSLIKQVTNNKEIANVK